MAELRGDGGARLIEEKPQMGFDFFSPKFINLLTPLSLFRAKRYLHYLLVVKFCLSFKKHHVNRRSCPRNINVKSTKLQYCLKKVR